MPILKVARMGHPVLRTAARPLSAADITTPTVQRLIDDMLETMIEYDGIGLAAPQVHHGLRLFLVRIDAATADRDEPPSREAIVVINPQVAPVGKEVVEDWEGCLSIPEIRGLVPRAREVTLRAFDRHGERIELRARDLFARVIQHETDHLDGVLFPDRMTSFESLTFLEEYARYHRKEN
jgi:peptide deformylase